MVCFSSLHKHSKPGKHLTGTEMHRFSHDENVCVVNILAAYNEAVKSKQKDCKRTSKNALKDTISRWIKTTMHKAGISAVFSAHSTRFSVILKKAGWSSSSTFLNHIVII
mgnify:CR=1 FL=1